MAEFLGTLLITYLLFRGNVYVARRFAAAPYSTWLVFSSGLAAAITGVALSFFFNDGRLNQAPAILIAAALISVYHVWRKPTDK